MLAIGWMSAGLIPWGNGPWALIAWCANIPALLGFSKALSGRRTGLLGVVPLAMAGAVVPWNGAGLTAEVGTGTVTTPNVGMWLWLLALSLLAAHGALTALTNKGPATPGRPKSRE